jgi:hypothetical protein
MRINGLSATKTTIGIGVLVLAIGGGTFVASAMSTTSPSAGDTVAAGAAPAVIAAPSLTEPVYVQRGDVTVGHLSRAEVDAPPPVDSAGVLQDPGYPNIGYSVYDENEVLVGYDTPHFGFVYLDEVESYKADPLGFVRQRALEVGIPVPEGF